MIDLKPLISLCEGKTIYIQMHNFPDADAISSAFGLCEIFKHYGISTRICCLGSIDRLSTAKLVELLGIEIYQEKEIAEMMTPEDYIICVDSQKNAGNIAAFVGKTIACIDHHPTFKDAEYIFKQVEIVGACATLVVEHYRSLGIVPTKQAATALLYAIKMDTRHFTRGVTIRDIDTYEYLFPMVDNEVIRNFEINNLVYADLKAYGTAINNIHIYNDVGFSKIPFSCPDGLIASLSDFILSLEEVNIAIVYSLREGGIKLSVRSMIKSISAGKVVSVALRDIGDGGGHDSMAGGFIPKKNITDYSHLESIIEEKFIKTINEITHNHVMMEVRSGTGDNS